MKKKSLRDTEEDSIRERPGTLVDGRSTKKSRASKVHRSHSSTVLDLGISALVDGEAPTGLPYEKRSDEGVPASSSPQKEGLLPKSAFEVLAEEGLWTKLSLLCESKIGKSDNHDFEARAWWIRAQLNLKAMPPTLLSAPLDSLSAEVMTALSTEEKDPPSLEVRALIAGLLLDFCLLLPGTTEASNLPTFRERAVHLDPTKASNASVGEPANTLSSSSYPYLSSSLRKRESEIRSSTLAHSRTNPRRSTKYWYLGGVGVAGMAFFLASPSLFQAPTREPLDSNEYLVLFRDDFPSLQPPGLASHSSMSHLDAVFYDLEGATEEKDKHPAPLVSPKTSGTVVSNAERKGASRRKEVIDTTSPIERPEDFLDFNESVPKREEEPRSPFAQGEKPIRVFKRGKIYKIVTGTTVMSHPSHSSHPITELHEGDRVEVEAGIGEWLKLRSRRGRAGYIMAQDATAVPF